MPYNKYLQIPIERYDILCQRYEKFTESLDDGNTKPVKLFDALNEKQLQELVLIRDVSLDLQKKRDEDIRKAAVIIALIYIIFTLYPAYSRIGSGKLVLRHSVP